MSTTTAEPRLAIAEVNHMDRDAFVARLGPAFEHSPWVAEGAWAQRPFASIEQLHAAMLDVVRQAPAATRLAFLRAHPELAGKEAQAGTLTRESVGEQASAGLDAMTRDEVQEMQRLNREYAERHGFPFIIAVRRHTKAQIFDALRRRAKADSADELQEALAQIGHITRLRVDALFAA